jgi:2-iminobutanoate/2-iminopropanoate deaminase
MRASLITIAPLLVSLIACQQEQTEQNPPARQAREVEYLRSATTAELGLPFSDAVRVGHLLFVSGQIGNAPGTTTLVPGGIAAETRQSLENVRTILEAHGSSMDDVVKCTIMMADISEWAEMNNVYVTFFEERLPARSALGANGLALGARVEIECWATVGL